MSFQAAVAQVPELTLHPGLQAVREPSITVKSGKGRSLSGSVNLDADLKKKYPVASRWDYLVGFKGSASEPSLYFIEVHPANSGEVDAVCRKHDWLTRWLSTDAPRLNAFPDKRFVWVASGGVSITNSRHTRLLALKGIRKPRERFEIPMS